MKLQDCINFILTHAQNSVFAYFKKELQHLDVTPIQYATLKCLWEEDGQLPSQLAETLHLDSSTVTGILGRLQDKGLIIRSFNTGDRRKVLVHLTEEGRALEQPTNEIIERLDSELTEGLSREEMNMFHSCITAIIANADRLNHKDE